MKTSLKVHPKATINVYSRKASTLGRLPKAPGNSPSSLHKQSIQYKDIGSLVSVLKQPPVKTNMQPNNTTWYTFKKGYTSLVKMHLI